MSNLIEKLNAIEKKIAKLLQLREALLQENQHLEDQVNLQRSEITSLHEKLETLQEENQSLKTANALLGSSDFKRETKFKINSLIRDIDHCISQLSE